MSYPPPNGPQSPGPGGGFGPPQGFGPPEQAGPPAGGYGYPGPPAQPPGGYGQNPPGGYGGYGQGGGPGDYGPGGPGPYPPPPGGGTNKVAVLVIAVVLGVALAITAVLLIAGGGDDDKEPVAGSSSEAQATDAPAPEPEPSTGPPSTLPAEPATPSAEPTSLIPYVELEPGTCFDHPVLNSGVSDIEERECDGAHDGEVVSNRKVTGEFASSAEIQEYALDLCEKDAKTRLQKVPQSTALYYPFALYPLKSTYDIQRKDTVSCAMTLSNGKDGKQLTGPIPGG